MLTRQFLRFILSGGLAAGLNWGSRFLFSQIVSFEISIILAYFVGLLSGFVMMRFFVFDGRGKPIGPQVGKYIAVNFFALFQTLLISILLARWALPSVGVVDYAEALGHLVGVLMPVITSYFGHKFLTFR